jgi:hypothetical protein
MNKSPTTPNLVPLRDDPSEPTEAEFDASPWTDEEFNMLADEAEELIQSRECGERP